MATGSKSSAQAQASFAQSDAMLARIVDRAAVGMVVCDMSGQLAYANHAFQKMLGYGPDQNLSIVDLVHADDDSAGRQHVQRLMRGETDDYRGEHRLRHNDGSALWMGVAASALRGEGPAQPDYLIFQITSIELQKRAEEALAYSESRWNFALEGAGQGVWDHDIRTDSMFYSRMWRIMRGIPPDEEVDGDQQKWLARIHPDDLQHVLDNVYKQDQGDEDFDALEYRERKRDGSYVWILSRGKPVEWDADGNPVRTLGTDTDVTKLKTVELELAAEKERLRVTLEAIADGMISTDTNGHVVFMNPAAELLTGHSSTDALGRPVRDIFALFAGETGERQACPVARCLTTDTVTNLDDDMILIGPTGIEREIRCTASPVRTQGDKLSGAVLVFQDVTQSRTLQRELAHSANHDDLTGLPNRAAFDRALNNAIVAATDRQHQHCLLYIDLDQFKPVNDTAGHAAGDALLQQVAQTIRGSCRSHDMAARIGGDEFAVLLQDCPASGGKAIADKMVRAIAALLFDWAGRTYKIGASIGMTAITATPASPLGFMGEADAACYAAKARGRGMAVQFKDI
ncbi:diguanylate cyclase [Devosia sp. BSSL-BM10]|uniref:Diguanylate cyclase n=1 Tax=Devosia litorisediminis TaxID=2829817 RepID=A0A942IEZ3_9HYPH|nr:diguanylate cyclase [Devosia litorisediminis]MBS3849955.1 diguanylate cyclase [Devosia litorisediminis]